MIDYKIHYIKTELTEVSEQDIHNKSYQIYFKDRFWDINEVREGFYHILDVDFEQRMKNAPMGELISKTLVSGIYKPVMELVDESFNQLILTKDLKITT